MTNFQMYRHIMRPGWTLGWVWAKKEIIWSMVGAQATQQGDCSKFKENLPHCCKKNPTVVDMLPGVPYNQQIANCCKGGVVASWGVDPSAAVSSFQLSVGQSGASKKTVRLPKNFTLMGPGPGYTCSQAKVVPSTVFFTPDGRRRTQAPSKFCFCCSYTRENKWNFETLCIIFYLHRLAIEQCLLFLIEFPNLFSYMQWHGMWRALTHKYYLLRAQNVVSQCHRFTTLQLLLVQLVLVVAKIRKDVLCKGLFNMCLEVLVNVA